MIRIIPKWSAKRAQPFVTWGRDAVVGFSEGNESGRWKYWLWVGPCGIWLIVPMSERDYHKQVDWLVAALNEPLPPHSPSFASK